MRLLYQDSTGTLRLTEDLHSNIPQYAILSHQWGPDEVLFHDFRDNVATSKLGYRKLQFCSQQAQRDNLLYFWVDTCCIDKTNHDELWTAINSSFRWYREAARCYVYLEDVSDLGEAGLHGTPLTTKQEQVDSSAPQNDHSFEPPWYEAFRRSSWFTRGWTLQELLAPVFVEFFSKEGTRLGDKQSLEGIIHKVTRVPVPALRNQPLSDFSVDERLSWMDSRETTRGEDKAYALLGIIDIYMTPDYGEGRARAFGRLREEINKSLLRADPKYRVCMRDLSITDPRLDKKRIEDIQGGLLDGVSNWLYKTSEFQRWRNKQWRNDENSRLLWIQGSVGQGKTMLLCDIINELQKTSTKIVSYFFCNGTDSRADSATAVLRGLIYMMIIQQPVLASYVQKKYDIVGKTLFEDTNAWSALTEILSSILEDPRVRDSYMIIDALDECNIDLHLLLGIIQNLAAKPGIRWIVSSRNHLRIESALNKVA